VIDSHSTAQQKLEAPVVLAPKAAGPATRLAPIRSGMNKRRCTARNRAPCGVGKVAIIGEQQFMELGVSQQVSNKGASSSARRC